MEKKLWPGPAGRPSARNYSSVQKFWAKHIFGYI